MLDQATICAPSPLTLADKPRFADYLRAGAKPPEQWRCGLEIEFFGYDARTRERLNSTQVARTLRLLARDESALGYEEGHPTEVRWNAHGARVTLEPGGQVEFSGAPWHSLNDVAREAQGFLTRLHAVAQTCGAIFVGLGFDPLRAIDEQHWYPKPRYRVMKPYLITRGRRAWDMMCRTCSVQVNLDYSDDADLRRKFLVGNRLAPVATALFANSPFADGQFSGYQSTRAAAWMETDPARSNLAAPALRDDFTPEDYVEYALTVPMLFARRDGGYSDAPTGLAFRDFLAGACPSLRPTWEDWPDHLTTIFNDARLKQHIEIRSADGGSVAHALSVAAFWKGLLYDADALAAALDIAPCLSLAESLAWRETVAREGLRSVAELAREAVKLAQAGLQNVAPEEVRWLAPAVQSAANSISPAASWGSLADVWDSSLGAPK